MTNSEILRKAIEKAIANGFGYDNNLVMDEQTAVENLNYFPNGYAVLIFRHDFAKAFFFAKHEDGCSDECCNMIFNQKIDDFQESWQFHLQQMVIEPEPLKYLEKFLTK